MQNFYHLISVDQNLRTDHAYCHLKLQMVKEVLIRLVGYKYYGHVMLLYMFLFIASLYLPLMIGDEIPEDDREMGMLCFTTQDSPNMRF